MGFEIETSGILVMSLTTRLPPCMVIGVCSEDSYVISVRDCYDNVSVKGLLPPPPKVKEVMFSPLPVGFSVSLLLAKIFASMLVCLFVQTFVCLSVCL